MKTKLQLTVAFGFQIAALAPEAGAALAAAVNAEELSADALTFPTKAAWS